MKNFSALLILALLVLAPLTGKAGDFGYRRGGRISGGFRSQLKSFAKTMKDNATPEQLALAQDAKAKFLAGDKAGAKADLSQLRTLPLSAGQQQAVDSAKAAFNQKAEQWRQNATPEQLAIVEQAKQEFQAGENPKNTLMQLKDLPLSDAQQANIESAKQNINPQLQQAMQQYQDQFAQMPQTQPSP